ncbi:hypothetical protein PSHT_06162 [Puccinia striiformis]|uniref:Uncharacterized protein n=1 Tax=Puccinia striiformis TaxID=27350 RepID=A0A2S4W8Q9_9BASI|nr:hypothetical protein PSHT_06162 [Puccinia striiformis]
MQAKSIISVPPPRSRKASLQNQQQSPSLAPWNWNQKTRFNGKKKKRVIVAIALLLTTLTRFGTRGIPYNDLPLSGEDYTIAILQGNPRRTLDVFRVTTPTFMFICRELLSVQMEPVSKLLQIEEQLAIFLYIVGHNNSNRQAQDRFQHSGQTISKVFRHVLELLVQLAPKFFIQPSHETIPHQIQSNPKFSPFFDKCLGALDGVHIPASVPAHKTAPYRNRKGFLSQNVLGVCDFGMRFTYMRVGWEGTAHDARVLRDARSKDFKIRQGFFYLADAGYGLSRNVLVLTEVLATTCESKHLLVNVQKQKRSFTIFAIRVFETLSKGALGYSNVDSKS